MDASSELQRLFGFSEFRPGQAEAVAAALDDRDALVVMPTGAGKSLCYQLPALMRDDLTIVVSPLVALMHDQAWAIHRIAPGTVTMVNSQRSGAANAQAMERVRAGEVRLLYVAPERFGSPAFARALADTTVGLFVVDEAHCVSQWGHDFRPDYYTLADACERLGARATLALTATATPRVAVDIAARLRLRDPVHVTTGFDRPNLSFAVVPCRGGTDKQRRLVAALSGETALPAIVYAGTRKACEELTVALDGALDGEVVGYHAGMDRGTRVAAQDRFMSGEASVIVATNAFGMGVDKSDVRTVCHATVPGSLEAYYQEAGRAGRDGRPARCLLFAEGRDKGLHVFFIQRSQLSAEAFERVGERLAWAGCDGRYDVPLSDLYGLAAEKGRGDADTVRAVIGHLARAGVLAPLPAPPDRAVGQITGGWDRRAAALCISSSREAERVRWAQYRAMWEYVEGDRCRRETLLRYFGDPSAGAAEGPCCDVCQPELVPVPVTLARVMPTGSVGDLDSAIVGVVVTARPPVGRTRAVEILRGGRSKVVAQYAYDGLPGYGAFSHLRSEDVLGRVDELLHAGRLETTGGRFPQVAGGMNVGVLASGAGTNLQALIDRAHGRDGVRLVGVASDEPEARALARAGEARIAAEVFGRDGFADRPARDAAIAAWLRERGVELVVLAGYMQLLSPEFLATFPDAVINVHPALLPAFPGLQAVQQALDYGVKVFGVTVHFVDGGVDTGPVILQRALELPDARDAEHVLECLHPVEHELLVDAVGLLARGAISFDPGNRRRVVIAR